MTEWRALEIYAPFIRVSGDIEVVRPERVSDTVNRFGDHLLLRNARVEPLSESLPVLSHTEESMTVAKGALTLVCPLHDAGDGNPALWREKVARPVVITTQAFSLMGDVHLDHRHTLQDHLERFPGDFLAVTNVSALWVTALASGTTALQRPFGLLNPAAIVGWTVR